MHTNSFQKKTIAIISVLLVLGVTSFLFAQDQNRGYVGSGSNIPENKKGTIVFGTPGKTQTQVNPYETSQQKESDLTAFQNDARLYRMQGLEYQRIGNLDAAMAMYQKAIEMDPMYAVAYNDLGVIYETRGYATRAEESYLKAVKVDSNYLSAYTNLALLYEGRRDLDKAAYYWEKRAELGALDDPWTQKARVRLEQIRTVLQDKPISYAREQEVVGLMKDVEMKKIALRKDNKKLALEKYRQAKICYRKGDEVTALKLAIDASQLDPKNKNIEAFVRKLQIRLLSR